MKKFFVLFLCFLTFSGCATFDSVLEEPILLKSKITTMDENFVYVIDLSTLSEEKYTFKEYSKNFSTELLIVKNNNLLRVKSGVEEIVFSTDKKILSSPIIVNDKIFFVAFSEGNNANAYLWVFEDNEIKKYWDLPVSISSNILVFEDELFFVESTSKRFEVISNNFQSSEIEYDYQLNSRVICKNMTTGEVDFICNGENICWKISGKEMFVSTLNEGFKLLNLENDNFEIIDKNLSVFYSPYYNSKENVLFMVANSDKGITSSVERSGFYYLDNKTFVSWEAYLDVIETQNEFFFDSILCWE